MVKWYVTKSTTPIHLQAFSTCSHDLSQPEYRRSVYYQIQQDQ
jgi:hypothetical protein